MFQGHSMRLSFNTMHCVEKDNKHEQKRAGRGQTLVLPQSLSRCCCPSRKSDHDSGRGEQRLDWIDYLLFHDES